MEVVAGVLRDIWYMPRGGRGAEVKGPLGRVSILSISTDRKYMSL